MVIELTVLFFIYTLRLAVLNNNLFRAELLFPQKEYGLFTPQVEMMCRLVL